jgi:hypothetical protein
MCDDTLVLDQALAHIEHQLAVPSPKFAFEVKYNSTRNERFNENTDDHRYRTFYAYHGTRIDNLHSILHIGFLGHMNKLSLFGSGTYFSLEPSVSLHYSPYGTVWANSLLGERLSCLLLCEIIDHPDHVKCAIDSNQYMSTNRLHSNLFSFAFVCRRRKQSARTTYTH